MTVEVALCVDELSSRNPGLIGLDGEFLESQGWLAVFSNGNDARQGVAASDSYSEAWVVSCDDVEPINLAAAIKADRPEMPVILVTSDACGSLLSRAHNAQIDEVIDQGAFMRRYAEAKRKMTGYPRAEEIGSQGTWDADGVLRAPGAQGLQDPQGSQGPEGADPAEQGHIAESASLEPLELADRTVQGEERAQLQVELPGSTGEAGGGAPPLGLPLPRPLQVPLKPAAYQASSHAFVMPVVSGSGGAGKSAVAALGALISQRMGHRTLLLDYDLQFGDVAMMVGVEDPLRIDVALSRPDRLDAELSREGGVAVIAPPERLEVADGAVRALPMLLDKIAAAFDVIIANTGAAWAEQHAALLERSSTALFLIDQRASSVRACKQAFDLCARCGIATGPFQFALNRCAKGAPLTSVDVSCALQGAPVFELKEGGRDVEDYLSSGSAYELIEERNEFAKSLEYVMERLLPAGTNPAVPPDADAVRRAIRRRGRHSNRKRGRK